MFKQSSRAESSSGVATLQTIVRSGEKVGVSLVGASGSGTVTITVRVGSSQEYESVTDGTISVSAPGTLIIEGPITGVKATSSNSGDSFTLQVVS